MNKMPELMFSVFYEYGQEIRQIDCVDHIWTKTDAQFCEEHPDGWLYLPSVGGSVSIPVRRIILVQEYV